MKQAGSPEINIAAKMAAFFELRKYPEYADVIIRLCEAPVSGGMADLLKKEMQLTAEYLRKAGQ